ncbi:MAG: hypothetical protein QNJ12_23600, partial [Ilumatobacter sp.]|nr:hypothetical protein [Ilumatobacter sp.]
LDVVAARSDASSSSARQRGGDRPVVRLAAPQMTPATLAHELAHALAGVDAGHGGVFRRAHVDLIRFLHGDEPAGWLADAYAAFDLPLGERAWSASQAGAATGPFAL